MREEEGTVLCDIQTRPTRNLCECILYFYGEICGIPENVPRFLKNAFHIPEERHLGLASLLVLSAKVLFYSSFIHKILVRIAKETKRITCSPTSVNC